MQAFYDLPNYLLKLGFSLENLHKTRYHFCQFELQQCLTLPVICVQFV